VQQSCCGPHGGGPPQSFAHCPSVHTSPSAQQASPHSWSASHTPPVVPAVVSPVSTTVPLLSVPGPLPIVVPESVALSVALADIVTVTVAVSVTPPIVVVWPSVADMLPCVADPSVALPGPLGSPLVGPVCVVSPDALSVPPPLAVVPPLSPHPTANTNPHPTIHLLYTMDR